MLLPLQVPHLYKYINLINIFIYLYKQTPSSSLNPLIPIYDYANLTYQQQ